MIPPILFQLNGILPANKYLLGTFSWTYAMRLNGALLQVETGPMGDPLVVELEVNGVLTGKKFSIAPGVVDARQVMDLGLLLPANARVRWKGEFAGEAEAAAGYLSITVDGTPSGVADVARVRPGLTVDWVKQGARIEMFHYDANGFTETTPGLATGKASIVQVGNVSVAMAIEGTPALAVHAGALTVNAYVEALAGGVGLDLARLEFLVGGERVAQLDSAGVLVIPELVVAVPEVLTSAEDAFWERFEFWSAGSLTAVFGLGGMQALAVIEGL